jgi:glycosyltransferase involved in cell wall biosynthesis
VKEALFLSSRTPFPATQGGKFRETFVLRLLSQELDVEVLCQSEEGFFRDRLSSRVRVTRLEWTPPAVWHRALGALRPSPLDTPWSSAIEQALRERAEKGRLLWVSGLAMARYIPLARRLGYRVILDLQSIESRARIIGALTSVRRVPDAMRAPRIAFHELRACMGADVVVVTSELDRSRLAKIAPAAQIQVLPALVDADLYEGIRTQPGTRLFFSGTLDFSPNVDGLLWFARAVLPRLRAGLGKQLPGITVAGANPTSELRAKMERAGIEVVPDPASMVPLLGESLLFFVPTRIPGGTRLKVLEAMAAARPVVSTGRGIEGLVLAPTYDVLLADGADEFASQIVRLVRDPLLRAEIGSHGLQTAVTAYDWRCGRDLISRLARRPG